MRKPTIAFLPFLLPLLAQAQTDTGAVYQQAVANAMKVYQQARGNELNLYKGIAEEPFKFSGKGTPYFGSGDWSTGSVLYENVEYNNVLLKYDLLHDELVALNPKTHKAFYLFKPRVESFTMEGKTFVNLKKSGNRSAPAEGYYEQLTQGPITLLQKHSKTFEDRLGVSVVEQRFNEDNRFYALKDGVYHSISNAKSLYTLAGNAKAQIKDRMKKQEEELEKNPEAELTTIATIYNQLNK